MAYRELPRPTGKGDVPAPAVRDFLLDVGRRKEFRALAPRANEGLDVTPDRPPHPYGTGLVREGAKDPLIEGLRLHGAQLFVRNFFSPDTPYLRLLLNWQTGAGKTLGAISIAREFVLRFRATQGVPPAERPTVFVVGFSKTIIQAEMLRHPGFVSPEEISEMARLRAIAKASGSATSPESRQYNGYVSVLKRRITDRRRGGYYRFMGYKEFGDHLFRVTRKGVAAGFKIAGLYTRSGADGGPEGPGEGAAEPQTGETFIARIEKAVRDGLVRVDEKLLASMAGGLLVADEIHNTYNVQAKNNYGIAIQYALDRLGPRAPRAVFMSATVVGGNPMEIVDLLNFLVPSAELGGRRLQRRDFFRTRENPADGRRVPEPLPGALERIGRLSAGRISYLLDAGADPESYPERIFEGEPLKGPGGAAIPYLKFTPCPMSALHARTLARLKAEREAALATGAAKKRLAIAAGSYAIYDIVYPNPEFPPDAQEYGLYKSDTAAVLAAAPEKWRKAAGVEVRQFAGGSNPPVIGGPFLRGEALGEYSAKYQRLAAEVVGAIKGGPGKILIYHHRVRLSGALQVAQLLSENGLVDATSIPRPGTLCSVCGVPKRAHGKKKGHPYAPARYLVVVSELDPSTVQRNLVRFNAPSNVRGYEYRALIGSKMIREGYDLKEVRFGFVLSLPTNISLLLQVLGRTVRKFSHQRLPPELRNVRLWILVSTAAGGGDVSPEVSRYAEKMAEYLLAQRVNAEIWRHSFDAFVNYEKVRRRNPALVETASLDTIPYKPVVGYDDALRAPVLVDTFEAYGYGAREVVAVRSAAVALFNHQPVWTYDDLWETIRTTRTKGLAIDPASFAEASFALALESLCDGSSAASGGAGEIDHAFVRAGPYYVRVPRGIGGAPIVDVESYVRDTPSLEPARVRVSEFVAARRTTANFDARLADFEAGYGAGARAIEDLFLDFDGGFLTRLTEALVTTPRDSSPAMAKARALLARLRVFVTGDDLDCPAAKRFVRGARTLRAGSKAVGYVAPSAVRVHGADGWYDIPLRALGLEPRHGENDVVVGYVESRGGRLRFKVRPPLHVIAAADVRDARSITRGAVCSTRPRAEQIATARKLGVFGRAGAPTPAASSSKLCRAIYRELLRREEAARRTKAGRRCGERWFYLFNETLPAPGSAAR